MFVLWPVLFAVIVAMHTAVYLWAPGDKSTENLWGARIPFPAPGAEARSRSGRSRQERRPGRASAPVRGYGSRPSRRAIATASCRLDASSFAIAWPR